MWDTLIITPFVNVLLFISNAVGNFGIAIILFTVLIRLVTHPLTVQQMKGTTAMQTLQKDPRWIDMQSKYKGDKEKLAQEQMKLYKELGVNPFGSCLPTIIQFPLIIGLYQTITLAMAASPLDLLNLTRRIYPGFLDVSSLLPLDSNFLWMNLSQPERLVIPGVNIGLPILAVVVVVTTYIQSKLITPSGAPGGNDQGAAMMKAMNLYMPLFMGYLALTLASGLSLYFVASNLIGIAQYAALGKVNWRNLWPFGQKPAPVQKTVQTQKPVKAQVQAPAKRSNPRKAVETSGTNGKTQDIGMTQEKPADIGGQPGSKRQYPKSKK